MLIEYTPDSDDTDIFVDAAPSLNRNEWLSRCAARYIAITKMPESLAMTAANLIYHKDEDCTLFDTPEQVADMDMSTWGLN